MKQIKNDFHSSNTTQTSALDYCFKGTMIVETIVNNWIITFLKKMNSLREEGNVKRRRKIQDTWKCYYFYGKALRRVGLYLPLKAISTEQTYPANKPTKNQWLQKAAKQDGHYQYNFNWKLSLSKNNQYFEKHELTDSQSKGHLSYSEELSLLYIQAPESIEQSIDQASHSTYA